MITPPITTAPSLPARALRALRLWWLRAQARQLQQQIRALSHNMALDVALLFALDLQDQRHAALARRQADDQAHLRDLQTLLAAHAAELRRLGEELPQ